MKPIFSRKYFFTLLFWVIFYIPLHAQPGINEFYDAADIFNSWYFSMSDFIMVIGALVGIIGGLRIYVNWHSGKHHHIDAQVIAWFFSCIFLSILGAVLKALFGI